MLVDFRSKWEGNDHAGLLGGARKDQRSAHTDLVPDILARYGGKVLARGGRHQIMEGPQKFHRFVVVEFPTFEQAVACFTSDEYDRAAAFRRSGAGEVETIIVDGGDATR